MGRGNKYHKRGEMKYDVIIVGSGIAGLYAAHTLDPKLNVLIITKNSLWDCNSFYAQGGVTVARDEKDVASHIQDTLKAGADHGNKERITLLSKESLSLIADLEKEGFEFDNENGRILYTKEGAHSYDRVVHAGGDATGRELHRFLVEKDRRRIMHDTRVFDLLIDEDICYGVSVMRGNQETLNLYADHVILAGGGIGGLYKYDTNAKTISGELQGIAIEKGLKVADMEMTQFHPTVYVKYRHHQKVLLSEALRGEGAFIVDEKGERFVLSYDERGEMASRDIVSRAIYNHQKEGHEAFLSFEAWDEAFFEKRFPTIYAKLKNFGYKIPKERVPISPAFHYHMGGIVTDENAKVKGMQNLYAVGEVAHTGVHGANRLASNSLLECFVFAKRASEHIHHAHVTKKEKLFPLNEEVLNKENDKAYKNALREVMWQNVGIIRTLKGLESALSYVEKNRAKVGRLTRLRFTTAKSIIDSAHMRKTSLGAHFIKDT